MEHFLNLSAIGQYDATLILNIALRFLLGAPAIVSMLQTLFGLGEMNGATFKKIK